MCNMLGPINKLLGGRRVILASQSPWRKQILENINFPMEVLPSTFEENLDKSQFAHAWEYTIKTSEGKAIDVAHKQKEQPGWAVVIGADTVIEKDGEILEKPHTPDNARRMLNKLNGSTHNVYTGVTLAWWEGLGGGDLKTHSFHEGTEVTFPHHSSEIIESYVESGEPLEKAGAYGIQGLGGTLVQEVKGDFLNVVGLPLHKLCVELITVLRSMDSRVTNGNK